MDSDYLAACRDKPRSMDLVFFVCDDIARLEANPSPPHRHPRGGGGPLEPIAVSVIDQGNKSSPLRVCHRDPTAVLGGLPPSRE